jgi:hypothetical protein
MPIEHLNSQQPKNNKCSTCSRDIPVPHDDISEHEYTLFKKDGFCKKCRENPQFRQLIEKQKRTCKCCGNYIAEPYNDETKIAYEAFQKDNLCPECRKSPTRQKIMKKLKAAAADPNLKEKMQKAAEAEANQNGDTQNNQIIYYRPTVVTDKFIAEMIWSRKETEPPVYMKYNFQEDTFEQVALISLGELDEKGRNMVYVPPFNDSLKKGLVIVPLYATETSFADVFKKVETFTKLCYDACGQDNLVKLLTLICIGSWVIDLFITDPLLIAT